MAVAESVLFEINSTNYSNSDVFLIYKPSVGCSGFVTTLRITVNLKSIAEADFPYIPDDTPADVLQEILDKAAIETPFKEVILYFKKGTGSWIKRAPIKIYNKEPYYDVNLMRFFSDSNTIDVSEDFSLGIRLKIGDVLTMVDTILVWGSVVEEKKNNGNEELAARIESLELALERLTNMPPATLLGRAAGAGIGSAQQITNNFVTQIQSQASIEQAILDLGGGAPGALNTLRELASAMNDDANFAATIMAAIAQKVGLTGNENVLGIKKFLGQYIGLQSTFPGFWLDELEELKGAYIVLNGGTLRIQRHLNNFGAYEALLLSLNLATSEINLPGGKLTIPNMPTSPTGLAVGSLYRVGSSVNVVV